MTLRENVLAILNYEPYERMPIVAWGYWPETVDRWAEEGHITKEQAESFKKGGNNSQGDKEIMEKLGFDFNWISFAETNVLLEPFFDVETIEEFPDGSRIIRDALGLICKVKPGTASIPGEIGTSLTDREAWETLYLPRFKMIPERVPVDYIKSLPKPEEREIPIGLLLGSLMGNMRNILGVEQLSYLYVDDEELYKEIIDTMCGICYECAKVAFETGTQFDHAIFWEDLCFKNGPLVNPNVFYELVGPWYKKITDLCHSYGVHIICVDCDGVIDTLIPTWLENGVNTMFPIEVGTWNASIAPLREKYGKALRGVGGMNKNVFAKDYAAVDEEVERLKKLVELGGYIPCPDHLIAPDAKFELVQYYCKRMREVL